METHWLRSIWKPVAVGGAALLAALFLVTLLDNGPVALERGSSRGATDGATRVESLTPTLQGGGGVDTGRTLYVNAPGDGFLALRSHPTITSGERILKIPHAHAVQVLSREPVTDRVDGLRDEWLYVDYRGEQGWVFGAYAQPTPP